MEDLVGIIIGAGLLYLSYTIVKKISRPNGAGIKVIRLQDIGGIFILLVLAGATILVLLDVK